MAMSPDDLKALDSLPLLAGVGAVAAVGQWLLSPTLPHWRFLLGRTLVTSVLSMSAGGALTFVKDLNVVALCGIAATLATLGTSFLEDLARSGLKKYIPSKEVPADEADH